MSLLLLSVCNPLCLALFILFYSFGLIFPENSFGLFAKVSLLAPIIVLLCSSHWLEKVSIILKNVGPNLKYACLLAALLFMLNDENYFRMIALAGQSTEGDEFSILALSSAILTYSAVMTLMLVSATILCECSIRFVTAKSNIDLELPLEFARALLFIVLLCFAATPILQMLVKTF